MANKFDLMEPKIKTKNLNPPYSKYRDTEEWEIIANLLTELKNNQDIELKTAPEYVIGYLVEKLRNRDLFAKEKAKVKIISKGISAGSIGLHLTTTKKGSKKL